MFCYLFGEPAINKEGMMRTSVGFWLHNNQLKFACYLHPLWSLEISVEINLLEVLALEDALCTGTVIDDLNSRS